MTLDTMPRLGFGTYGRTGAAGEAAILHALEAGYRHLDTAQTYGTEAEVGRALRGLGPAARRGLGHHQDPRGEPRPRPPDPLAGGEPRRARASTRVDLALIHWPRADGGPEPEAYLPDLAEAQARGLARRIGVSNFTIALLDRAIAVLGQGALLTNQVEVNPWFRNRTLADGCAAARASSSPATSPSPRPACARTRSCARIGAAHGAPPERVALAWELAMGWAAIPTSGDAARIALQPRRPRPAPDASRDRRDRRPRPRPAEHRPRLGSRLGLSAYSPAATIARASAGTVVGVQARACSSGCRRPCRCHTSLAQRCHLLRAGAEPREHAAVLGDEVEAVGVRLPAQRVGQPLRAARACRAPHRLELGHPVGAERGGRRGSCATTFAPWSGGKEKFSRLSEARFTRATSAVALSGRQQDRPPGRGRGRNSWSSWPRSSSRHRRRHQPHARGVGVEPVAEALVGEVDQRHRAPLAQRVGRPRPTARASRLAPVGLWQQPCSSTMSPAAPPRGRPSSRRNRPRGWRRRNSGSSAIGMPEVLRIAGWFGQVGSDSQTVAPGARMRISSKPCRIAPVPPGVATAATRSRGTASPRTSAAIASREGRVAGQPDVGLGGPASQSRCSACHRAHHRRAALGVLVDADAEVDLLVRGSALKAAISARILSAGWALSWSSMGSSQGPVSTGRAGVRAPFGPGPS